MSVENKTGRLEVETKVDNSTSVSSLVATRFTVGTADAQATDMYSIPHLRLSETPHSNQDPSWSIEPGSVLYSVNVKVSSAILPAMRLGSLVCCLEVAVLEISLLSRPLGTCSRHISAQS